MMAHSIMSESGDTTCGRVKTGCTTMQHLLLTSITGISRRVTGCAMMTEITLQHYRKEISGKYMYAKLWNKTEFIRGGALDRQLACYICMSQEGACAGLACRSTFCERAVPSPKT